MRRLIIIPAYNEESNIEKLLTELGKYSDRYDCLVVNDCSTDETTKILNQMNVPYLSHINNLGIGGAVQSGYIYALQNGYDIAIQLDGDGQHNPAYLDSLIKSIEDGIADICIGSRFIEREGFQSTTTRRLGIKLLGGLIYVLSGKQFTDVTSGYRAVNKKYIAYYAENYPQDYPEPEAIMLAIRNGASIQEVPVEMRPRTSGESTINIKRSIYYMIKVSFAVILAAMVSKKGK